LGAVKSKTATVLNEVSLSSIQENSCQAVQYWAVGWLMIANWSTWHLMA